MRLRQTCKHSFDMPFTAVIKPSVCALVLILLIKPQMSWGGGPSFLNGVSQLENLLQQEVQDKENPAVGQGNTTLVGGSGGGSFSAACASSAVTTDNYDAVTFLHNFAATISSVAGLIRVANGRSELIGTAAVYRDNVVITAGHVIDEIAGGTETQGVRKLPPGRAIWLVFDLTIERFPHGLPDGLQWDKQPGAVQVTDGDAIYRHHGYDIGAIVLNSTPRSPLLISGSATSKEKVVLVGVPGRPTSEDADALRYVHNYKICGLQSATDVLESPPVTLRIGTGTVAAISDGTFRFTADTLGGDSGAPIFDQDTGRVIGMNVATPIEYRSSDTVHWNEAVLATPMVEVIEISSKLRKR